MAVDAGAGALRIAHVDDHETVQLGFAFLLTDLGRVGYLDALNADLSLADTLMRPVLDVLIDWQLRIANSQFRIKFIC